MPLVLFTACAWVSDDDLVAAQDQDDDGAVAAAYGGADCDDRDPTVHPGAPDPWYDGRDADCAANDDFDRDGDGFVPDEYEGVATAGLDASGALPAGDCDDDEAAVNPGAAETCAAGDEDCDGARNDDDPEGATGATTWYADADGDTFGSDDESVVACESPEDWTSVGGDCDDGDAGLNPSAAERCGGGDEDCDGSVDESDATDALVWYPDGDLDGWGAGASVTACAQPTAHVATDGDCDDARADVSPSAAEVCDGADNDCDGALDYGVRVPLDHGAIQDAIDAAAEGATVCVAPGTYEEQLVVWKALTVEGGGSGATVVDAGGIDSVVWVFETSATLRGLTLTGGYRHAGAGIHAEGSYLELEDIELTGNLAENETSIVEGAALVVYGGSVTADGLRVHDNEVLADYAHGAIVNLVFTAAASSFRHTSIVGNETAIYDYVWGQVGLYGADATFTNVILAGNDATAADAAGRVNSSGLTVIAGATATLTNVTIHGNESMVGGGSVRATVVDCDDEACATNWRNVIVTGNVSDASSIEGAVETCGGESFAYTDIWGNDGGVFGVLADPTGAEGNVSVAPDFVDVSSADPSDWDLRLSAGSDLIDLGDPSLLDADGTRSDPGAYGGPGGDW